jgi:hypothetical protein
MKWFTLLFILLLPKVFTQPCIEQKAILASHITEDKDTTVYVIQNNINFGYQKGGGIYKESYDSTSVEIPEILFYREIAFSCFLEDDSAEVIALKGINGSDIAAIVATKHDIKPIVDNSYIPIDNVTLMYYEKFNEIIKLHKLVWQDSTYLFVENIPETSSEWDLCISTKQLSIYSFIGGNLLKLKDIPLGSKRNHDFDDRYTFKFCLAQEGIEYFKTVGSYEFMFSTTGFRIKTLLSAEKTGENITVLYQIRGNQVTKIE